MHDSLDEEDWEDYIVQPHETIEESDDRDTVNMADEDAKTTQSPTTAAQIRESIPNLEEYLILAPLYIAIMGEIVFISTCDDLFVNKNTPKYGFKNIKDTDSFRARLMQIYDSGLHAFKEAHKNMDQIRNHTKTVAGFINRVVYNLFSATNEVIENLPPNQLENICEIAEDCVKLADGVEKKYSDVISLIQKLLEACDSTQHFYREELENVNKAQEAQDEFKQSMNSLLYGWDLLSVDMNQDTMIAWTKSGAILVVVGSLTKFVSGKEIDWKNLYDQRRQCLMTDWTGSQFKKIFEEVKKLPEEKICEIVLSICQQGLNICEELKEYRRDKKWDETEQLIKKITKLNDKALAFDFFCKNALGFEASTPKPPMMYKAESTSSESKSAAQRATDYVHFKIEQSQEQLKQTWVQYEKCVENMENMENMEKNQKELTDIVVELQNCKIKLDLDCKTRMLCRVKEQWEKMVCLFQVVSIIVKTSLSQTLHNFVTTSEDTKKLTFNDKLFIKDVLYKQAFQAFSIASLVHMSSTTYTEVSNKYLMDRVNSLGTLMAMDKEEPEFLSEHLNLQESCWKALEGILKLVLKNKDEFQRKADGRMAEIEGELKAILSAFVRIKERVNFSFSLSDEEADDYLLKKS